MSRERNFVTPLVGSIGVLTRDKNYVKKKLKIL